MKSQVIRSALSLFRRRTFEAFGSARYSRPSLYNIDSKLEKYLDFSGGFFVEAGANDGYSQSNTYYFEKFRNWSGVLIEAIPELYRRCIKERRRSRVYHGALVADDFRSPSVTMKYSNLMSLVDGAMGSEEIELAHILRGAAIQRGVVPYQIEVPATTLTRILDRAALPRIDLLSLDVEGYELQVLRGLDFTRYRPMFVLVEANYRNGIDNHLAGCGYRVAEELSHRDVLYTRL